MPADASSFAPAVMTAIPAQPAAEADLLHGLSTQLRSLAENQSRDAADLGTRLARVEDDLEAGRGRSRSLAGMAGATAAVAFLGTSLVWQLGHRAAVIDRGVREMATAVSQSAAATEAAFARIDGRIAEQSTKVDRIAAAVATVQAAGDRVLAALDGLGRDAVVQVEVTGRISRQLTDTAVDMADLRNDMRARFAREHDVAVAERAELQRSVTEAITRVERVMLDQATELKNQREQFAASARRLGDARRQLLVEATGAVGAQLDGLRQILDGLRAETAASGPAGVAAGQTVTAPASAETAVSGPEAEDRESADGVTAVTGEEPVADATGPEAETVLAPPVESGPAATPGPEVAGLPDDSIVE